LSANALSRLANRPDLPWLVAYVVLAAAALIRVANIDQFGFNSDEAVYAGQAAALAGNQNYADMFGIFRAHPLLVQFMVAVLFKLGGVNDLVPRVLAVIAGLALVCVAAAFAYRTGNRAAALIALVFAALSPYAITISRQFLLDGPMALFCALSLYFMAIYIRRPSRTPLVASAAAAGLAFLAKETGILLLPAYILFFLIRPSVPLSLGNALRAAGVYLLTVAPFPLALLLGGGNRVVGQYAAWQVLRRPNHTPDFYLHVIPDLGLPMVILAVVGIFFVLRKRRPEDLLLLCFMAVTFGFFQLWPVKGYQYLVVLVMPTAVLAADGLLELASQLSRLPKSWRPPTLVRARTALVAASVVVLGATLVAAAGVPRVVDATSDEQTSVAPQTFLAGTGGLEAGRPAGLWVRSHTPPGSRFLTIGPSFANVIQFYGQRVAQALSVSPNPLHRNPAYEPVGNPDLEIRSGRFQYLVYDAYSASRSPYFASELEKYVRKHDGTPIYTGRVSIRQRDGTVVEVPTVVIYEVHP
jgi:4-amino-4-deoxy-L-arabinose transferase-like glycosyltransferase